MATNLRPDFHPRYGIVVTIRAGFYRPISLRMRAPYPRRRKSFWTRFRCWYWLKWDRDVAERWGYAQDREHNGMPAVRP